MGISSDFLWLDISNHCAANYCLSLDQSILDFGKAKATSHFLHQTLVKWREYCDFVVT
jgi:hypothetical protein